MYNLWSIKSDDKVRPKQIRSDLTRRTIQYIEKLMSIQSSNLHWLSLCLLACLFAYLSCKLLCTWHYSLISTYLSSSSSNFPYKIIALLSFYNFQQLILIKQSCKFSIMIHNFVLLCFYFIYKILWFIKYFYIYVFKFFT